MEIGSPAQGQGPRAARRSRGDRAQTLRGSRFKPASAIRAASARSTSAFRRNRPAWASHFAMARVRATSLCSAPGGRSARRFHISGVRTTTVMVLPLASVVVSMSSIETSSPLPSSSGMAPCAPGSIPMIAVEP